MPTTGKTVNASTAVASLHARVTKDFPHVTADNVAFTSYSGFLHVGGQRYRVRVAGKGGANVAGDEALAALLRGAPAAARRRVSLAPDAHAVLLELRDIVERALSASDAAGGRPAAASLPPASFYEQLLSEISDVGWDSVASMDESMRSLGLRVSDSGGRDHVVLLQLPATYPVDPPSVSASLPEQFVLPQWKRQDSGLSYVLQIFREVVERFQDLFNALDDIDANTWVLEPERPIRSDAHRRIALGRHASLRVSLDPRAPSRAVPECRFLGAEAVVAPLRASLNERIRLWDTSGKVLPRANLERVLELSLPPGPTKDSSGAEQAASADQDDMAMECGICYSYRLEDRVPDVACDRAECARPYHRTCLVDWLKALPDTKKSFETLFGTCPYCEKHISVSTAGEG